MIYFIIFLLALLTFVTLLHLHFLVKKYIRFSVHWLLPQNNNINCPKFNSSTDRLRTVFSLLFFFTPLIVFNEYNQLPYQNKIFHVIILTILIGSTCLLLYINKHKIWSKSFRTIPKKKNKIDLLINFIEGRLDTINLNEVISETESKVDNVKSIVDSKIKTTNKEEIKSFESFFIHTGIYKKTIKALEENKFFEKPSKIKPTNLSILVAKLIDLKLVKPNIKQKNLCKALEKYFKIEKVDPSILSRILNNFKDNTVSVAHQDTYDSFLYLNKLYQT